MEDYPAFRKKTIFLEDQIVKIALKAGQSSFSGKIITPKEEEQIILSMENESKILRFLKENTDIPVPEVLYYNREVIVYKKLKGNILEDVWSGLNKQEKHKLKQQLGGYIKKMSTIDLDLQRSKNHPQQDILEKHLDKKELIFSHADLHQSNIIVDDKINILGVIDWEYANRYPKDNIIDIHNKTHHPDDWYDIFSFAGFQVSEM